MLRRDYVSAEKLEEVKPMVKCKDCVKLKAYFEASRFCEGNPEKAIEQCVRGMCDDIHFSYFECDKTRKKIDDPKEERECESHTRTFRIQ